MSLDEASTVLHVSGSCTNLNVESIDHYYSSHNRHILNKIITKGDISGSRWRLNSSSSAAHFVDAPLLVPEVHSRQGIKATLHERCVLLQLFAQNPLSHVQNDGEELASVQ